MKKAEELINKHLDKLNANNIVGKDGNIYKGFLNAVNEALTIHVVSSTFKTKVQNELNLRTKQLKNVKGDVVYSYEDVEGWCQEIDELKGEIKALKQVLNFC